MKCCAIAIALLLVPGCNGDDPVPDLGPTPDQLVVDLSPDQSRADQGIRSNSGRICKDQSDCAPGDECLLVALAGVTTTSKMCVLPCDSGTSCPVPSTAKNSSRCFLRVGAKDYCVWFCMYGGKSYECPVPGAYQCFTPNSTEPEVRICIPN